MVKSGNLQMLMSIVLMSNFVPLASVKTSPKHCKQISRELQICVMGCEPGWYGPYCNKRCRRQCNISLCDQSDGGCTLGCNGGLFKYIYRRRCTGTTMKKEKRSSDGLATKCLRKDPANAKRCVCCNNNFRGDYCAIFCENCETYNGTNFCRYMCKGGVYGEICNNTCPINCKHGAYDKPLCSETKPGTPECITGCAPGFYGPQCNHACSKYCKNSVCFQRNGLCVDCQHLHYGDSCSLLCSNSCSNGRCHKKNGSCYVTCPLNCATGQEHSPLCTGEGSDVKCYFGCKDGYHGLMCEKSCIENCKICNQKSGECLMCKDNFYGDMCESNCGTGCSRGLCYDNGTCKQCVSGLFGEFCTQKCGSNCLYSNCVADSTDDSTYLCYDGCRDGFSGRQCDEDCPGNCAKCLQLSNPIVCVDIAAIASTTEGNPVVIAVTVTCVLVVIILVIIVFWKRRWFLDKCQWSLGRRYSVRGESARREAATSEERQYLDRHPEFHTSSEIEKVKSFRRYQQYFRHIEARDSKKHITPAIPLTRPISVAQHYRSWPGGLNRTRLKRPQQCDSVTSNQQVPTVVSHSESCSSLDDSRCIDFTKTWFMWKENNEDRHIHSENIRKVLQEYSQRKNRDIKQGGSSSRNSNEDKNPMKSVERSTKDRCLLSVSQVCH